MPPPIKLQRPIVFFDLETTGLDFKYDRIIEIAAIKVFPDGREEKLEKRINPGMRIPEEVTLLTGISNKDVETAPTFREALPEVALFFEGCDIGGYNVLRFDAKVIAEEFKRNGMEFQLELRSVVDAKIIFHQKEKRDLAAALKFYCNQDLKDAHSAYADTKATLDIWYAQMKRYDDLPTTVKELHQLCLVDRERFVDSEGKFFWRDGQAVFNFGKHKSKTLQTVAQQDPDYLQWVISPERRFGQDVVDICYNAMNGKFPEKKKA